MKSPDEEPEFLWGSEESGNDYGAGALWFFIIAPLLLLALVTFPSWF